MGKMQAVFPEMVHQSGQFILLVSTSCLLLVMCERFEMLALGHPTLSAMTS